MENPVEPAGTGTQLDANAEALALGRVPTLYKAILEWTGTAKTDATRDKRIGSATAAMEDAGHRLRAQA